MNPDSTRLLDDLIKVALSDRGEKLRVARMTRAEDVVRRGFGDSPKAVNYMILGCHDEYKRRCYAIRDTVLRFLKEANIKYHSSLLADLTHAVSRSLVLAREGVVEEINQMLKRPGAGGRPTFDEFSKTLHNEIDAEIKLAVHGLHNSPQRGNMTNSRNRLFVAMPFRPEYDPVFQIIRQAADLTQVDVVRVDQMLVPGSIISHIYQQINESDLMVAVLSEENGNVYYEVGLAHSQAKPVIILTEDVSKLKFDLRDHRAISYDVKNPRPAIDALAKTIATVLNVPHDAVAYFSTSFSGLSANPQTAYEKGVEKAKETVIQEAKLQRPVEVTKLTFMSESNEYAIELTDFMETRVRAIIDINGVIRTFKKLE
jgi:chorismate mutase